MFPIAHDWTEEVAGIDQGQRKHVQRSTSARLLKCQQSLFLGPKIPLHHLNVIPSCKRRVIKHLLMVLRLQRRRWPQKLWQNLAVLRRKKARQKSDVATHNNLLPRAKVQPQAWLPSSKRPFSDFAVQMNKGFNSLGEPLKAKNETKCDDNASALSDSASDDNGAGGALDVESEEPAR